MASLCPPVYIIQQLDWMNREVGFDDWVVQEQSGESRFMRVMPQGIDILARTHV